jgi:hypothetical protein
MIYMYIDIAVHKYTYLRIYVQKLDRYIYISGNKDLYMIYMYIDIAVHKYTYLRIYIQKLDRYIYISGNKDDT